MSNITGKLESRRHYLFEMLKYLGGIYRINPVLWCIIMISSIGKASVVAVQDNTNVGLIQYNMNKGGDRKITAMICSIGLGRAGQFNFDNEMGGDKQDFFQLKLSERKRDTAKKAYVKSVLISIPRDSILEYYYKSNNDFVRNKVLRVDNIEWTFNNESFIFRDSLNDYLLKWNYIDTSKGFFSFAYKNSCYIRCDIKSLNINAVLNTATVNLVSDWKLYGVTGEKELYHAVISGQASQTNFYVSENNMLNLMTTALVHSLTDLLKRDSVSHRIQEQMIPEKTTSSWDTIKLVDTGSVQSLQDAVKAVVTVIVADGHGSGCIISPDGYFITNHHVVAEENGDEVKVITSGGDTLKAKYVRGNASYDLALYKIETAGPMNFFSPNLSLEIKLGTEVYAIGTPTDIELGQTLTRGIISSKRKVGDRFLIQTDVSINPGNSGGGLVDNKGILLGIVNASLVRLGVQGIGFAIPAHYIEDALKIAFVKK